MRRLGARLHESFCRPNTSLERPTSYCWEHIVSDLEHQKSLDKHKMHATHAPGAAPKRQPTGQQSCQNSDRVDRVWTSGSTKTCTHTHKLPNAGSRNSTRKAPPKKHKVINKKHQEREQRGEQEAVHAASRPRPFSLSAPCPSPARPRDLS